jgi:hypothetical protein
MEIEKRKEILIDVLNWIKYFIKASEKYKTERLYLERYGLCDLVGASISILYNCKNGYKFNNPILNDIQRINCIKFKAHEYYSGFCEKGFKIKTTDDLKLWYVKRIEALEKTIEYYNCRMLEIKNWRNNK